VCYSEIMYEGNLFRAIQFTSHKHKNQMRKCFDYPYVTHPMMVFHMVSKYSENEAVHIAALLHDIVEDTDTTLGEIEEQFGYEVSQYVAYLSEDKSLGWRERKDLYAQGFIGAPKEVLLIKAADILYNLTDTLNIIEHYPDDQFVKNIHKKSWLEQKKIIIEIIKKEWIENPFLPKVDEIYVKLDYVVSENNKKSKGKVLTN